MPETPSKLHMYDMVKIDKIVFDIVNCLKYPGSDRVRFIIIWLSGTIIVFGLFNFMIRSYTIYVPLVFKRALKSP